MRLLLILLLALPLTAAEPEHDPGDGGPASAAFLNFPEGLAIDGAGHLFVSERGGNRVRRIDARSGIITTIAGTGEAGYGGDGGPATQAKLTQPTGLAVDRAGNVFIGDTFNWRIRRVDARTGVITTIAGTGEAGFSGDGEPASTAQITAPFGLVLDAEENLYFTDTEVHRIRRIDRKTGIITTVAGDGVWRFRGEGVKATEASLARPHVLAFDRDGNLIVGDSFNQRIRRIDAKTGIITTIAGMGLRGSSGDGGPAREATFCYFGDLLFDARGELLVSGVCDHRIRRIAGGTVHAFASGFQLPAGMAMDGRGNLYVADMKNHRIQRIDGTSGRTTTIAGGKAPRNPSITWRFVYDREEFIREQASTLDVRQDVPYANDTLRRFDLYRPPGVAKPPLLVLVGGRNDTEVLPDTWGNFVSWARLFAAGGYGTVMFNHGLGLNGTIVDGAEDVEALFRYVRAHGDELGVDASRVTLVVFGMASTTVAATLRASPEWLERVVLVSPYADVEPLANWQAPGRTRANAKEYSLPATKVRMLIVRSGKEDATINAGIDRYIAAALAANAPLEVVNHPEGDRLPAAVWGRVVDWLR